MDPMVLLVVIIEKSFDLEVNDALTEAGITAFTRTEGTGSGVWQSLDRWVDPEKLIYYCVIRQDAVERAFDCLKRTARMNAPGVGIAFTVPVGETIGLVFPAEAK